MELIVTELSNSVNFFCDRFHNINTELSTKIRTFVRKNWNISPQLALELQANIKFNNSIFVSNLIMFPKILSYVKFYVTEAISFVMM